jgi:hypothetical protein
MPPASPPSFGSTRRRVDVRSLSLTQLQALAAQGSRRARAELESRMRAAPAATAAPARAPSPSPAPARGTARPPSPEHLPTLTVRARVPDMAEVRAAQAHAPAAPPLGGAPAAPYLDRAEQLALMARQDEQRSRADGPPRLVGMVLIGWGLLMLLGALALLARGGGAYYLFCAVGVAAVGWLLLQRSRWAMALHGGLLLVALGWAWRGAHGSMALVLVQAAPLLIPAVWMAVRPVREPLE